MDRRRELVEQGWHPSGTTAPTTFMTHEFGHHLMFWLQERGIDVRGEVAVLGNPGSLGLYAQTHFAEAFSEGFAARLHGDAASRNDPITRGILGIIDREVARARVERSP
jgi:hypothetical protein